MNNQFSTLKLRPELTKNLSEIKFSEMTPIQAASLPLILEGKDIVGQAKTGSGKTASFGLGILNSLDTKRMQTKALVLCPTRELAEQVALELRKLARMIKNVKITTITGGVGYFHQERSLEHGAHIIVGTPGRVMKLIKTQFIETENIESFVLDEADRMLDMGFYDQILEIEKTIPKERQTLLFSATFPENILKLSESIQKEAQKIEVDATHENGDIEQYFYKLDSHKDKSKTVLKLLGEFNPERLIIFCKTKRITDDLADFLNDHDIDAESIHGDLEQNERTKVLTEFSNNSLPILVATDVAARGIDIKGLSAVINFDLPLDTEDYVHRIGRTGRAGEKGLALSLFLEVERDLVDRIKEQVEDECKEVAVETLDESKQYLVKPPMMTIYISGGKKQKLRPGDILGALVKEAGLEPSDVGDISILPIVTYVAIAKEKAQQAVDRLSRGKIKNRNFRVGLI